MDEEYRRWGVGAAQQFSNYRSRLRRPWVYVALVYALSWTFTVPLALSGANLGTSPVSMVAYALGGLGPAIAAIVLVYLTQDRAGRRDYWLRIIDIKRIPLRWYGVIVLTVPTLTLLAALLDRLLDGPGLRLEAAARFIEQPLQIVPFALFILVFGPVPEEIGWRGYLLDQLQANWNALAASLVLGTVWALWHLPQFYIAGTYQSGLGVGSLFFWLFLLNIVVSSILYTWIYNNTGRSTLAAILFHFMQNFTGELFELSIRADVLQCGVWIAAAVIIVSVWGARTLTGRWSACCGTKVGGAR